jgi:hypothetical protein
VKCYQAREMTMANEQLPVLEYATPDTDRGRPSAPWRHRVAARYSAATGLGGVGSWASVGVMALLQDRGSGLLMVVIVLAPALFALGYVAHWFVGVFWLWFVARDRPEPSPARIERSVWFGLASGMVEVGVGSVFLLLGRSGVDSVVIAMLAFAAGVVVCPALSTIGVAWESR